MEVKAKNISRGDEITIISDNVEIIADIILNELCSLDEVDGYNAYYETEYDFDIKDPNKITKYILASASRQTNNIIHAVHITIYLGNGRITGLTFDPEI